MTKKISQLVDVPGGVRDTDMVEVERVDVGDEGSFKVAKSDLGGGGSGDAIRGTTPTTDVAPGAASAHGGNAYPQAATNNDGADLYLSGGIGRRFFTIVNFALLSGTVVHVNENGVLNVLTEGAEWTAATSNAATAASLAAAIELVADVDATVVGDVIYLTPALTTRSLAITTDDGGTGMTATSGSDGSIIVGDGASTLLGDDAGKDNTGDGLVAVGESAAQLNSGASVTAIGTDAGLENTGNNSTFIGYATGEENEFDNVVVIGSNAAALADNSVQIGDASVKTIRVGGATTVGALPSAVTIGAGARAYVTDLTTPAWNDAATGGGAVPGNVTSDGTIWRVG